MDTNSEIINRTHYSAPSRVIIGTLTVSPLPELLLMFKSYWFVASGHLLCLGVQAYAFKSMWSVATGRNMPKSTSVYFLIGLWLVAFLYAEKAITVLWNLLAVYMLYIIFPATTFPEDLYL